MNDGAEDAMDLAEGLNMPGQDAADSRDLDEKRVSFAPDPLSGGFVGSTENKVLEELNAEEEEDKAILEDRKRKQAEEEAYLSWYRDPKEDWETFNPQRRFGTLSGQDEWVYDNITSSYKMTVPGDHYAKFLQSTIPKKEDGMGRWFTRPHHVETLTTHVQSKPDNTLNTRYYSNYNCEKEKKKTPELEEAMSSLEEHLAKMKDQIRLYQMRNGTFDPDLEDRLYEDEEIQRKARR
jgi:hypothetical protein